ncbi:solute carrier family 22 member 5-like [Athalia rosae]|uniref:solute carrier family 22 member 5-like n=1 Tax=Athalia rosae TaxID=37344 RepID=UPI00203349D8|nr:solute carrier family 22 member 5-like [Athalia rosae]
MTSLASFFYASGIGLAPVLLKVVTSIDHLVLLVNEPCLLFLLAINFLPESPAWLFCTRNSSKLGNVIIKAAKTNHNPLPSQFQVDYIEHRDVEKQLPKARPKFWDLLQAPEIACEIAGIGYLISLSGVIFGSTQAKLVFNEKRVSHWYVIMGLDAMSGIMISQFCVLMMGHRKLLHVTVFLIFITTGAVMINLREDYSTTTGPTTTLLAANIFAISLNYGVIINYSVRTVPTLLRGTYLGIWNALWAIFTWVGVKRYLNYPGMSSTAIITILLAALVTLNIRDLLWRELPDTVNDSVNFKDKPKPKRWSLTEQ